jgi:ABC-type Fe3+/spermidine/putrescine transport system ATPase subunit
MSIELRNITKRYGSTTALNDVSLTVEKGEFVTLLGPSGCGKTTLLRIVAGLTPPDEGEVLIDGALMNGVSASRRPTGMVFQNYALFPHLTVQDNISFGLRMRRAPRAEVTRKVRGVAELAGIAHLLDRYPSQLSGGQQQRVALARTLAIEPYALLLDEPLAALDRKLRIEMRTELRKLLEKVGITAIFVTHDQEEALTMSDRIAVMDHGVIVQFGSPMEIYDEPSTAFVASFVGNSNLFTGRVEADGSGRRALQSDGASIPLPPGFEAPPGETVSLLIRPEHLIVRPLEPGEECAVLGLPGTVSFVTHLGTAIEYEIVLHGGAQLRAAVVRSRGQEPVAVGSRVCVEPADELSYLKIEVGGRGAAASSTGGEVASTGSTGSGDEAEEG